MQVTHLHKDFDRLQTRFCPTSLVPIYGAGCVKHPALMLVFMNPTGKNIASDTRWQGLRAPWLGTKNIWGLLQKLSIISRENYILTQTKRPGGWTTEFCLALYNDIASNGVYITNLAKCTQIDARPLPNAVFREYMKPFWKEVLFVRPQSIVTFGNQVSSLVLEKNTSVGEYTGTRHENLIVENTTFRVYPTWYPVGQGMRNLPLAVKRVRGIIRIL